MTPNLPLPPIVLDDGQVIQGMFKDLTHHELLSLANQLLRARDKHARLVFQYQHKKFWENYTPPRAA
jgi:hypothetical protein